MGLLDRCAGLEPASRLKADPSVGTEDLEKALDGYFDANCSRNLQEVLEEIQAAGVT